MQELVFSKQTTPQVILNEFNNNIYITARLNTTFLKLVYWWPTGLNTTPYAAHWAKEVKCPCAVLARSLSEKRIGRYFPLKFVIDNISSMYVHGAYSRMR